MTDYEEKEYGDPVITFQLKNWDTSKGSTWYESCAEAIDELVKDVMKRSLIAMNSTISAIS